MWSVIDVILQEHRNFPKVNLNPSLSLVEINLKTVVVSKPKDTLDNLVQFERFLLQRYVKTENLSSQGNFFDFFCLEVEFPATTYIWRVACRYFRVIEW